MWIWGWSGYWAWILDGDDGIERNIFWTTSRSPCTDLRAAVTWLLDSVNFNMFFFHHTLCSANNPPHSSLNISLKRWHIADLF